MKAAVIVALSCALLCNSLGVPSTMASACGRGQASLKLVHVGQRERVALPPGHLVLRLAEHYAVTVAGTSALDFADVPEAQDVSSMSIYLVVASHAPVEIKYSDKVDMTHNTCLEYEFHRSSYNEAPAVLWGTGVDLAKRPVVCFVGERDVSLRLNLGINPVVVEDAGKLKASDVRVYVEGKRKSDGKTFTLFDTNTPCKE